ncbi:DUF479 domain-containing protein [bacterium SCSIO 12741]|nr:DUF479 domain-containing protein [bacterium SCSIO 12741]
MNHLAHIYLSGDDDDIIVGNYIADFVKGKKIYDYSSGVQKGIVLHRAIDSYTDSHPLVKNSVSRVRNSLGKFAGIAVDVYYDHFLAIHWSDYHKENLEDYAQDIYALLQARYPELPQYAQRFFQFMIQHNILVNYGRKDALRNVFYGLSQRTRFPSQLANSVDYLNENYEGLYEDFKAFFQDLIQFSEERRLEL